MVNSKLKGKNTLLRGTMHNTKVGRNVKTPHLVKYRLSSIVSHFGHIFRGTRFYRIIEQYISKVKAMERRITGASLLLMSGLMVAKVLGFIKIKLYLHYWGVGEKLDIFYGASAVPDTLANFIITGILSVTLVPFFVKHTRKSRSAPLAFTISLFVGIIWLLIGSIVVGVLFMAPKVGVLLHTLSWVFGVTQHTILNYLVRFRLLVAMLFLASFFMVMANVIVFYLQSRKRFFITSLTGALFNLGVILALLIWYPFYDGRLLTLGLAILTASVLVYLFMLVIFKNRGGKINYIVGFRELLKPDFYNEIFLLLRSSSFRAATVFLEQTAYFVTVFWIMGIGSGVLTMFKLAEALRLLFVHIVVAAVAQASLPIFSSYIKEQRLDVLQHKISKLFLVMFLAFVGAFAVYLLFGKWLILLLIGKREQIHIRVIYNMLLWSLPLLFGQSFLTIFVRLYYAMDRYKPVLLVGVISLLGRFLIAIPISLVFFHLTNIEISKAYGYILGVGIVYILQVLVLMVKLDNVNG